MTTSTFVAQDVQPRTWSISHWMAASTSVPPPPKSCAGPASAGETSDALPVKYLVTFACASDAGSSIASRSNAPQPTVTLERTPIVSLLRRLPCVRTFEVFLNRGRRLLPRTRPRKQEFSGALDNLPI